MMCIVWTDLLLSPEKFLPVLCQTSFETFIKYCFVEKKKKNAEFEVPTVGSECRCSLTAAWKLFIQCLFTTVVESIFG